MEILTVNSSNIEKEHVCCAISEKKGESCLACRKAWMKGQFDEGLIFKKLNVNGKVFIEYQPAENAWIPVDAPGYLFIKCFWVSGQYKGHGYADTLLAECIKEAQNSGKLGLVILSSGKKMPFLSDPGYLKHKGFLSCDTALPYFELLYLPLSEKPQKPQLKECCKKASIDEQGFVLYYSDQCPYSEKYALLISEAARKQGETIQLIKYLSKQEAQNAPSPFTIYSLFYNGSFVTNEILSVPKFIKLMGTLKS
jgi:hypothetical protein